MKKKKYKIIILDICIFGITGILVYSMFHYFSIVYYRKKNDNVNESLIKEVVQQKDFSKDSYTIDFQKLKSINSDIIGWISVLETNINYPIVKGNDNEYYLNHNVYKDYNIFGSIYMNMDNSKDFSDFNTVLFGHNNYPSDSMFSDLIKIYNGEVGHSILIYIYLENDVKLIYQVYAAYVTNPNDDEPLSSSVSFFYGKEGDFVYEKQEDLKTLTLSTCYQDGQERLIVHALKVS